MFELMAADHDSAQGAGHWKAIIEQTFDGSANPTATPPRACGRSRSRPRPRRRRDTFSTVEEGAAHTAPCRPARSRCCRTPGT